MPRLRIEVLERGHRPLLRDFQNQERALVDYLRRFAFRHSEKDLLSRTFLALDEVDGKQRVCGYFSLATVSVERASVVSIPELDRLPRFPIPGVLLAQLAVDRRVQGQGLGRFLFDEALGKTLTLASVGPVAFRLFVADAISEEAAGFYERRGFERLSSRFPARMVLDLKPVLEKMRRASK